MPTYQELMSRKAALEKEAAALQEQIENAQRAERAEVINQIKSLMAQHGISFTELGARSGGGGGGSGGRARSAKPSTTGRKVAVKYRDEATGNTWSGRGLQPNWLKNALAEGRKLEDFAV
jgi:DNA-binding protein H-NS